MTENKMKNCKVCAHLFGAWCYTFIVNPNTLYSFCYTPISNKNTFSEKGQSHNCPFLRCGDKGTDVSEDGNASRDHWFAATHTVAVNMALTKERLIGSGFYDLATAYQNGI